MTNHRAEFDTFKAVLSDLSTGNNLLPSAALPNSIAEDI